MIGRLKLWASLVAVFVMALAASWFSGRKAAKSDIKARQLESDLTTALRTKEIENDIETLGPDALRERAHKWVRPPQ